MTLKDFGTQYGVKKDFNEKAEWIKNVQTDMQTYKSNNELTSTSKNCKQPYKIPINGNQQE